MNSFVRFILGIYLFLLLSSKANCQIFYYDFIPNDSALTFLNSVDKKIRKEYKKFEFTRKMEGLSEGERDDIFTDVKSSKPDSSNSYRVHFFADKKLEEFQIIACSKNYPSYNTMYRNGVKGIIQIKSKPAYELDLINFNTLLVLKDFNKYQSIIYESFVNILSNDFKKIDLNKRFSYNAIEIDTTFKVLLSIELYNFSRDDTDRWQKEGTTYYYNPSNPESKLSYQKRTEFYTEETVVYKKYNGTEVEVIYRNDILPHSVGFTFEFERYQELDSLNTATSLLSIHVESKYIGLSYLNDEKNQTIWTEWKTINEYLNSYIFEKSMEVLLYKLKWDKIERLN